MSIRYADLGSSRKLRDIVFAGSHDASITSGAGNVQTQSLDIAGQADAGVRLFDLRILARTVTVNGEKRGELVGYHGSHTERTADRKMMGTGETATVERSKMRKGMGSFGLGLAGMLTQAKKFVEDSGEFLIFKFDKSKNWNLIAQTCVELLDTAIYKVAHGMPADVNQATLKQLSGKVVCVFSSAGTLAATDYGPADGILGFRNLYSKEDGPGAFDTTFAGLQYFGKGGTKLVGGGFTNSGKAGENVKKQSKLMGQMAQEPVNQSSNVLGMIYWTTTGVSGNIQSRNDSMWTAKGMQKMESLWRSGLEESISARCDAKRIKASHHSSGSTLKTFMPNIVMIDFADADKCKTIYELNTLAATLLTNAYKLGGKGML